MNRRDLLKLAPAALAATATPAAALCIADPADPMVDLAAEYEAAFDAWDQSASETAEEAALEVAKDAIKDRIQLTPITTAAGFAAFCRFVHVDNYFRDPGTDWPDLARWQWDRIRSWAEARALVA
ncbi:MAG: hypothetical protein Q4615_14250 [Paracoccus aminovorans]|nr:hypothetical protein [Paracoccus aminovorans]